jgi:ABC-type lipoprotein release transport system permease subunit
MYKFTFKQTLRNRTIWTALLIAVIGAQTALFEVFISLTDGLTLQQQAYVKYNAGFIIMYGGHPITVGQSTPPVNPFDAAEHSYPLNEAIVSEVTRVDGVEAVFRVLVMKVRHELDGESVDLGLVGVETRAAQAAILPYANIWKGRFIDPEEVGCAVVSNDLEKELGLAVGDSMSLSVLGSGLDYEIVGVYGRLLGEQLDPGVTVVVDLAGLLDALDLGGQRYSALLVKVSEPEMGRELGKAFRSVYSDEGIEVVFQGTLADYSVNLISTTAAIYGTTNALILMTAAAVIVLIRLIDLVKSRGELGLLTSVGWRERDVTAYLLLKSLMLGVMGSVLGLTLAAVFGPYISDALIPRELAFMADIRVQTLNPVHMAYIPVLAVALSALGFIGGYLYYRRLTPLKMLEET